MIAGYDRVLGLVLVTNSINELERVPGLLLEDWSGSRGVPIQSSDGLLTITGTKMKDDTKLKRDIVDTFQPFKPEKIILFGSRARGHGDEESDIDLILVYETPKPFLDRLKELYLAWEIPKAVDILAYTPEEFDRMKKESAFIQEASEEGEVLYERS